MKKKSGLRSSKPASRMFNKTLMVFVRHAFAEASAGEGGPVGIRTPNLLIRSQVLYPIELRVLPRKGSKYKRLLFKRSNVSANIALARMLRVLFVAALALLSFSIQAQTYLVSGFVTDSESGEPLIGANVFEPELSIGTVTNNAGYYSLYLPAGRRSLQFTYLGYAVEIDSFFLGKNLALNAGLIEDAQLQELVVKARNELEESPISSTVTIPSKQINQIPAILGEIDLIKAIQLLPGVQSGTEGSSGLYVRGGTPDQNYILIDGVPVYNINHMFGFFSAFNNESISNFNLYKGGFPARFGSRLSSVLDINMKEGNSKEWSGMTSVSPIAISAFIEGPIIEDKTTIAISGRRTLLDVLYQNFNPFGEGDEVGLYFYDVTGKVTHRFSEKDKLSFSIYHGRDKLYARMTDRYQSGNTRVEEKYDDQIYWGNLTSSLRWGHLINSRHYSTFAVSYTRYQFNIGSTFERTAVNDTMTENLSYLVKYFSGIRDWSAKADFEYTYSTKQTLRYGAVFINHGFAPGAIQATVQVPNFTLDTILGPEKRIVSNEAGLYIEDDIKVNSRLRMNAGLRVSLYQVKGAFYGAPEPRFSARYFITEKWAVKASYTYMNQYLHLLTNSGLGLPTDLWVPATAKIKPQRSHQGVLALVRTLQKDIEFSVEGYYKTLGRVIDYSEGAEFINTQNNWEDKVEQGNGRTYGVEFLLQKKQGDFSGWIGYTLSWNKRQFENINFGREYYFRYDRRHYLSVVASYKASDRHIFSATFVYGSGNAITFPYGRYFDIDGNMVLDYIEKNGYRMRDYIRLDLGYTNIRASLFDDIEQQLIISVYNVLNRANPFYMYIGTNSTGAPVAKEVSLLPFIPAITYVLRF